MKHKIKKIGIGLSILYILFISLFALDSLGNIWGFLIHMIPTFIFTISLLISIKKEKLGGIIFIVLSVVFTVFFHTYKDLVSLLIISFPLLLIGILFYKSS